MITCIQAVPAQRSGSYCEVSSLSAQLQVVLPRHCVSRDVHQRSFLWKVEATLELDATGLPVPGHLGNAIGLTDAWPGFSGLLTSD